jgi:hypothetical protein
MTRVAGLLALLLAPTAAFVGPLASATHKAVKAQRQTFLRMAEDDGVSETGRILLRSTMVWMGSGTDALGAV